MKISKSMSLLLLSILGWATSCSDYLDIQPLEEIVLDNYWTEESDVENVIASCYLAMQSSSFIERAIIWGEARSENLMGGERISDNTSLANIMKENITQTNDYTTWVDFYKVINNCNTIIRYAPKVVMNDPGYTESEMRASIAEASALRDLCYFYLIRTFRDVPYTTEPFIEDIQTMDLPATPFADVLDSLTSDLERVIDDAVIYYPVTHPLYQTGRITRCAIHAMLCDMYLWKQDYPSVVSHADAVIASELADYQERMEKSSASSTEVDKLINGFPLISDQSTTGNDYGLAYQAIFCQGNSTESIFELTFTDGDADLSNYGICSIFGSADGGNGRLCPSDLVGTDIADGQYSVFLNRYDVRSYENIYRRTPTQFLVSKYASQDAVVDITSSSFRVTGQSNRWPKNHCHANWIVYRLSDVMLMKAEALVAMVNDAEDNAYASEDRTRIAAAYNIVEAVNKRSFSDNTRTSAISYSSYNTKVRMQNLIYDERNRELMFEGKRWFDLVRRSMNDGNTTYLVSEACRKYTNNKSAAESKLKRIDAIFWPYNEEELKVNRNLKQNPAYGSSDSSIYEITQ